MGSTIKGKDTVTLTLYDVLFLLLHNFYVRLCLAVHHHLAPSSSLLFHVYPWLIHLNSAWY